MQAETHAYKNLLINIELNQAFNEVDTNKDGLISPQEARQGIILAGERIPGRSFGHIIQMFDDNHDGQMSLEEFLNNVQKLSDFYQTGNPFYNRLGLNKQIYMKNLLIEAIA
ncbi:unnamed protein product [Rotaria sordida]|uniref:EF-hand domain-containing protein n=1 Tax=Rotaria sordida TaxID=392033 RepID=A0A819JHJ7_9BILA|nr:unnamed protein product [Rotaria sordida]